MASRSLSISSSILLEETKAISIPEKNAEHSMMNNIAMIRVVYTLIY